LSADFLLVIEEHTVDYDMEVHGIGCDGIYEKVLSIEKDALPPRGLERQGYWDWPEKPKTGYPKINDWLQAYQAT
tara:strand:+ start:517 stop:741 length:225 start_codon:yes stop_codon:yes gene_type:complete